MDLRRYELVTVAAAQRLRSSYCSLAHGKVLVDQFLGASELQDVLLDRHAAGLAEVDVAVMDLAEKLVEDATSITQSDIDHLRDLGLSDTDIFDVVVAAGARCFFSKTLDALGTQPDASYADLEPPLRDALTVGRPIAIQ
jgi:alkylhydroperoxidase family enzyme